MRAVVRALEALADAAGYLAGAVVLALALFIAVAVFSRRVLNAPILSVDEVSGYLLLGIVFLGLGYTMKAEGHIRADIVLAHVPAGVRGGLDVLATLLGLLFVTALLVGNWWLVTEYHTRGTLSFRYLQIPLWIPASLLVLGTALLLIQLLARLLRQVAGGAEPSA